jgi:hypothetical protein
MMRSHRFHIGTQRDLTHKFALRFTAASRRSNSIVVVIVWIDIVIIIIIVVVVVVVVVVCQLGQYQLKVASTGTDSQLFASFQSLPASNVQLVFASLFKVNKIHDRINGVVARHFSTKISQMILIFVLAPLCVGTQLERQQFLTDLGCLQAICSFGANCPSPFYTCNAQDDVTSITFDATSSAGLEDMFTKKFNDALPAQFYASVVNFTLVNMINIEASLPPFHLMTKLQNLVVVNTPLSGTFVIGGTSLTTLKKLYVPNISVRFLCRVQIYSCCVSVLSGTSITGRINPQIKTNWPRLTHLDVARSNFFGAVPWTALSNLDYLDVCDIGAVTRMILLYVNALPTAAV